MSFRRHEGGSFSTKTRFVGVDFEPALFTTKVRTALRERRIGGFMSESFGGKSKMMSVE